MTAKNDPFIGRQLANFEVKRLLGSGGMAHVYYGWDVKLHRPVAIKIISPHNRTNPSSAQRFVREARMMAKWRHENIVHIYYADDSEGMYYYVMEYVDGRDLATVMSLYAREGELMPTADILRICGAVANALDYAHQQGIIHRDVKPANILLAKDGRVILGDFGLALDTQDKTQGEAFGTPHYISPEQARRSADAIPQSDIYSLGVILFEMLTGVVPFDDPSPAILALQHITQEPPSPRELNPDLSEAVEKVLLKALEKKPKDRYQTGEQLMIALEKALSAGSEKAKGNRSLPPIPVSAPTIRRSAVVPNDVPRLKIQKPARNEPSKPEAIKVKKPAVRKVPQSSALSTEETRSEIRWLISSILFVFIVAIGLIWLFANGFFLPPPVAQATPSPLVTAPLAITSPALPTATIAPIDIPSAIASQTVSPLPPTSIPTLASVVVTPTVRYPEGLPFILYYNASSFYLYNNSKEVRSLSGFNFERVNADGTFSDRFEGWRWEKFFKQSQPDRCVRLEIYMSDIKFLNPAICKNRYHSTVQPTLDSGMLFWTPKENSAQFRVLWKITEIARCEISAGVCNIYVP